MQRERRKMHRVPGVLHRWASLSQRTACRSARRAAMRQSVTQRVCHRREYRMSARVVFAAFVAGCSGFVVALSRTGACSHNSTPPREARFAHATSAIGGRLDLATFEAKARAAISTAERNLRETDESVVHVDELLTDARETILALCSSEPDSYLRFRDAKGMVLSVPAAIGMAEFFHDRKIISSAPPKNPSAVEIMRFLWSTRSERRMDIADIIPELTRAGRGTLINSKSPNTWPYGSAAQFSGCLFDGPSGRVSRADGERLNDTDRSAHVVFGVLLADGATAHIRLNYFYDDRAKIWVPVTIATGSSARDFWPWPVF